ncbi:MAG: PD-(D/E)XK motif protein [Steroidobacteraceae bacterium]
MSLIRPEIWRQVESAAPAGDELVGRQAVPACTSRLLAAADSSGRRHLLILLYAQDAEFKDVNSRGLTARTEDLSVRESEPARYINLLCEDPAGHSMLDLVGGEIAERLQGPHGPPAEIAARVLAKWRRFWGQLPQQLLSRESQIGLFSELWFLAYWLVPAVGPLRAVESWRGPHGARHDFECQGLSIEVKGTSSARGRIHTINGIDQLEEPDAGQLLLFSLRLRDEAGAGNSLPLLCHACRQLLAVDSAAADQLDLGLISAGYLPTHEEEYSKNRWRVVEEHLFQVREGFPRITRHSFQGGIPQGIEGIDYVINLGSSDSYVVARKPSEAISILAAD